MKRSTVIVMLLFLLSCLISTAYAEDYRIKSGDNLGITVMDEADLTKHVLVDPQGNITLPLINEVSVANMTTTQAAQTITKRLAKFLKSPQVSVELIETGKLQATVSGEVRTPGIYSVSAGAHLMDVLTQAGGYKDTADLSKISVTHTAAGGTVSVDLNKFLQGADISANIPISAGDTIVVPSHQTELAGTVSVLGSVKQPGDHAITKGMKFSEIMLASGGITELADTSKISIRHMGTTDTSPINYASAMAGDAAASPELKPGDVIYVGSKTLLGYYTIQGAVGNAGKYDLKDNTNLTEAIAIAGGVRDRAKLNNVNILRNVNGATQTLQANVNDIMSGKSPNVMLQDKDSIYIPQSGEKPNYLGVASVLLSLGWLVTR